MESHRKESIVLLAAGGLLTALAVTNLLTGRYGAAVVTGLGATLAFVLVVLVTRGERRRSVRP